VHSDPGWPAARLIHSPRAGAAARETAVPNLFAIPSGPSTSALASLLFSPHLQGIAGEVQG